ncbi:MAG: hypothetical protein ACYC0C_10515 [Devosia sp.]
MILASTLILRRDGLGKPNPAPLLRSLFDADKRWLDHYGFRPLDLPTLFGGLSS